jgi:hypothetical protein
MAVVDKQTCVICGQAKNLSEFYHPPTRNHPRRECIECGNAARSSKTYSSAKSYINRSLSIAKSRAKRKGWVIDKSLTPEFLIKLYNEQRGLCAISSLPMSWNKVQSDSIGDRYNGTNISIDRIDSSKPYTTDNVRLVCNEVNRIRSDMTDERLYFWAGAIYNSMQNLTIKS